MSTEDTGIKNAILGRLSVSGDDKLAREILSEQVLIRGETDIVDKVLKCIVFIEVKAGQVVIQQGADDDDMYFIANGELDVLVNGRHVASRARSEHVGEMAVIDPIARRGSSVVAKVDSILARISSNDFRRVADEHFVVWKRLAAVMANRLNQREKFHLAPRSRPVVFIGSTVEGLRVAREIEAAFKYDNITIKLWTNGVFEASSTPIESLTSMISECDFGVMLVTPDDKILSRGDEHKIPRDNVIFELGLLIGKIGRQRTFMMMPSDADVKIPTDLLGVTPIKFVLKSGEDVATSLSAPCHELRKNIEKLGVL